MVKPLKKQIVFLEPWPEIMMYKMARLLKKDYETVSIRILENKGTPDSFFKEAFDKIISFELSAHKINIKNFHVILKLLVKKTRALIKAIREISKLKPSIIICRATPSWPCALTKKLFKNIPVIYFPYDIRSIGLEDNKSIKKYGVKKFELKAERFCFENADGIIHKGHPEELKYVREEVLGKGLKIKFPRLSLHPYCSKEFFVPLNKNKESKKDNEIHTVYIGSMGKVGLGKENYIIKCCNELVKNYLHVHVYMKSNCLPSTETLETMQQDFKDLLKSKYFHIHDPLGPKQIVKEISKYDYGLLLVSEPLPKEHPEKKGGLGIGNKNASYLEAGIPCIYDNGVKFIGELMEKYNVGFNLGELKDIPKLKDRLKKVNYKKIEDNIINARNDFLMEKNFPRLKEFIEEITRIK